VKYSISDGREVVDHEPRSGRPCTSKTEENVTKVRVLVRSDQHLTVTVIGSELNLNHQIVHDILTEELGMRAFGCCVTTTFPVTLPSSWTKFWPKRVFQWFRNHHTRLIWVRVTSSFSRNSNPTQRSSFWNCWQHPKGRDRPAEGTSTWRLTALLPGVGTTSAAVCGFPRELLWRGWC
jgi:hypothetical protein